MLEEVTSGDNNAPLRNPPVDLLPLSGPACFDIIEVACVRLRSRTVWLCGNAL